MLDEWCGRRSIQGFGFRVRWKVKEIRKREAAGLGYVKSMSGSPEVPAEIPAHKTILFEQPQRRAQIAGPCDRTDVRALIEPNVVAMVGKVPYKINIW